MEDLQRVASGLDSGAYSSQGDSSVAQEKSAAAKKITDAVAADAVSSAKNALNSAYDEAMRDAFGGSYLKYKSDKQGETNDEWRQRAEAAKTTMDENVDALKTQLEELNKQQAKRDDYISNGAMSWSVGDVPQDYSREIERTKAALEEAQRVQQQADIEASYAAAYAKEDDLSRQMNQRLIQNGYDYGRVYDEANYTVQNLEQQKADAEKRLSDAKNGDYYEYAKVPVAGGYTWQYVLNTEKRDAEIKKASDDVESLTQRLYEAKSFRDYAEGYSAKGLGASQYRNAGLQKEVELLKSDKARAEKYWEESGRATAAYQDTGLYRQLMALHPTREWNANQTQEYFFRLGKYGEDNARDYAAEVNTAINDAKKAPEKKAVAEAFAGEDASTLGKIGLGAAAIGTKLVSPISSALSYLEKISAVSNTGHWTGREHMTFAEAAETAVNARAGQINKDYGTLGEEWGFLEGKGWGDIYQLAPSIAQSVAYGNVVGEGATLAAFFFQAADSTFDEAMERTGDAQYAQLYSTLCGAAEVIGEKVSLDHLLHGAAISPGYMLGQSLTEGGEELATSGLNMFFDKVSAEITGNQTEIQQKIDERVAKGESREQAEKHVWDEITKSLAWDFTGGALSGGISGVAQSGPQIANELWSAHKTRQAENAALEEQKQKEREEKKSAVQERRNEQAAFNPLRKEIQKSKTTDQGAQEAAGNAQESATETAAPEQTQTKAQRYEEIQTRLDEINKTLDEGQDEETNNALYQEAETLYQESRRLASEPEVIQQQRVDAGQVSKGYGTEENHIDKRTEKDLSKPSVKAFQFDHPELHPYFAEAAQELIADVEYAEKLTKAKMYESGSAIESGPIRKLMDMGLSRPDIIKALQAIIANNGQENYAGAKKVERVLHEMMTDGWRDLKRQNHDAIPGYIAAKDAINGAVKADSWEKYLADNETILALGEVTEEQLRAEWEKKQRDKKMAETKQPSKTAPAPASEKNGEGGGLPASEQTTAERTNGTGNERERNMAANLRQNEKAEPALRQDFDENRELYTQLTNAEVTQKAEAILAEGYEAARNAVQQAVRQAKAGMKLAPEMAVAGYHVATEMAKRGDIAAARELCSDIAAELTYSGQLSQIGRLIIAADPSIRISTVEKLVKKLNDGLSNRQKAKNVKQGKGAENGSITVSDEALQRYAEAETEAEQNEALDAIEQEIADQIPATFRDKFTALRYLNMLGNLKTQGRNIVGNAAMMTATNIKYLTQHVIELARAAATGGKYEVNTALNTSKELRQQAAADFEANADEIKGDAKYADVGRQAAKGIKDKQQIFGTKTGNVLYDNTVGRVGKGLEVARKATNWAMEVGDEIFLRQVYVRSFAGWMKAHGVTDVNNASPEQVSAAREFAKKEAQEATFHDSNQFSEFVTSIDANWDKGHSERVNKIGAAAKMITQGIMPFRKTPANVAVRAIEYSPVGAIGTIYEAIQAKKGNASAADVINSAAKNLTGTALFGIGMLLAAAGRARASGDDEDEKLNEFEKLQGEMDYSIKVGGKYISLSQLAPMAIPFFMGVKLNELLEYNDNLLSLDSLSDILGVVSDPMLEMSMLSGVNDFLNDLSSLNGDTDAVPSLVTNAALSYLSQGLTNSLLGQLEQASERNRQTTYSDTKSKAATAFDRFLGKNQYKIGKYSAKIPGLDYNQQDYVDAWGRTQSNGGAGERAFNAFLNPTYTGKDRSTDVDEELERLYRDNKGKDGFPNVFPQKRSRSDVIGDGVVMTPDEYLAFSKESGQKKLELVREFIQSSDYKNLTDEQRAETIHNLYAFADATALQKVRDANGVTVENKYAKISDLSDVPAYLAATERFKAEAAKEGKEFDGWTNTNFEKYVSAGLKAEDLDVLAESALSDTRKPAYDLMREVGMSPKEYMDAIVTMDGEKHDGQFKQADVYNWLVKNTTMSTEQKNQLWDILGNNWKTSFSNYKPK